MGAFARQKKKKVEEGERDLPGGAEEDQACESRPLQQNVAYRPKHFPIGFHSTARQAGFAHSDEEGAGLLSSGFQPQRERPVGEAAVLFFPVPRAQRSCRVCV